MGQRNKLLLSLIGLVAGISLLYNNCSPPVIVAVGLLSFLCALKNKNLCFFVIFLFIGTVTAYLHIRIPANDITRLPFETVREAEGKILSVRPDTFATSYIVKINRVVTADGKRLSTSGRILLKTNQRSYSAFLPDTYLTMKSITLKRISPPKNPYTFDYRSFMERRGVYLEGKAKKLVPGSYSQTPSYFLYKTKSLLKKRIENALLYFPEERELLETITLGKENIPDFLREAGIRSGTYHILVISGAHFIFILLFLRILFLPFAGINNRHPKFFPSFSLLFMWFYAGLTGFQTPVVRAVLMLSFFNVGEILERDIDGVNSIVLAAILMLVINPYSFFDASFQLSFIATAGIILFFRRFNLFNRNSLQVLMLTCFSAQIAVLPILLYHFGLFYPIGLINNLVFLPFSGILLTCALMSFIFPFLFVPLRYLLIIFLRGITVSSQSSSFVINLSASLWLLLGIYGILLLIFYAPRKKHTTIFVSAVTLGFLLWAVIYPYLQQPRTDRFYVLSFSMPSALYTDENNLSVAFLADHYKRTEIEDTLSHIFHAERIKKTVLFYTTSTYNHTGTLNDLKKSVEVQRVYEYEDIQDPFSFPYNNIYFYKSYPDLFKFLPPEGEVSANGLVVERIGEEKGKISYVIKKGDISILFTPYIGDNLSENVRGRRFTIACIYDVKKTQKTTKNLATLNYLYLILPRQYKKFSKLPPPDVKAFYLSDGAVKIDLSSETLHISHF